MQKKALAPGNDKVNENLNVLGGLIAAPAAADKLDLMGWMLCRAVGTKDSQSFVKAESRETITLATRLVGDRWSESQTSLVAGCHVAPSNSTITHFPCIAPT